VPDLTFLVPGSLEARTGGYAYDRRIIGGLRDDGWRVRVEQLDPSFPHPTAEALEDVARRLSALPSDSLVMIDGLALGAMPEQVEGVRDRVRVVALVHHPLGAETGLDPATAARLTESECRSLSCARLVVVTSEATADVVRRLGVERERLAVVRPGTDVAPMATGSGGPDVRMLTVATLTPRKGHGILLEALSGVPVDRWRLDCVGSPDRSAGTAAQLVKQVEIHGLAERVRFLGELDDLSLEQCYAGADLFVLPTIYEGFGMVVGEALARGLPIVSTRTGAIPEMVPPDAGVLVAPGELGALRDALTVMLMDAGRRERCAAAARRAARQLPTWTDATRAMVQALNRASEGAWHG
jgi:glycosyltransferase involved in cell wall biosynthesis